MTAVDAAGDDHLIGDEWFVDPTPPLFLRALAAAKAADKRWVHGEP